MIGRAHRGLRRSLAETTYLIDATGLRLRQYPMTPERVRAAIAGAKS